MDLISLQYCHVCLPKTDPVSHLDWIRHRQHGYNLICLKKKNSRLWRKYSLDSLLILKCSLSFLCPALDAWDTAGIKRCSTFPFFLHALLHCWRCFHEELVQPADLNFYWQLTKQDPCFNSCLSAAFRFKMCYSRASLHLLLLQFLLSCPYTGSQWWEKDEKPSKLSWILCMRVSVRNFSFVFLSSHQYSKILGTVFLKMKRQT